MKSQRRVADRVAQRVVRLEVVGEGMGWEGTTGGQGVREEGFNINWNEGIVLTSLGMALICF